MAGNNSPSKARTTCKFEPDTDGPTLGATWFGYGDAGEGQIPQIKVLRWGHVCLYNCVSLKKYKVIHFFVSC